MRLIKRLTLIAFSATGTLALASVGLVQACAFQQNADLHAAESVKVDENVPYGVSESADLRMDVYQPATIGTDAVPAVLLFHGGGWTSLNKSTMRGMGSLLARSGFVAFAVDYRLFDGHRNRWPAQLDDAQRAVRWVRANAAKYHVNPDRIGAFGHSAGAQLAALLGMEETRDDSDPTLARYSSKVQAVVDVSGPSDFTRDHDAEGNAFLASFFGTSGATETDVWRRASPVFRVAKGDAPFLLIHGTHDENVPIAQAEELYKKLQENGVPVSLVKVDDVHTFQTPVARRQLAFETLAFFTRNIGAPAR